MIESLFFMVRLFQKNKIPYCLIGGLAVMLHHGRANTVDIDFYILVEDLKEIEALLKKEGIFLRTAGEYQLKAKVKEIPIDLLYADHYIGTDVITRAVEKKLGEELVRVATPEDLIVLKTLADRTVDHRDIEELREIFGSRLDDDYIEKKLKWLKDQLES